MFDDPGNSQYEAMAPGSSWNDAMSNKAKRRPATTRLFLLNDMAVCDCRRVLAVRILQMRNSIDLFYSIYILYGYADEKSNYF